MFGQAGDSYAYLYADRLAELGWKLAVGQAPDAKIVVRIDPVDPAFRADSVPAMYVHMDNVDSPNGSDVTTRLRVAMSRHAGEKPALERYGPTHVEEGVMLAAMEQFFRYAAVAIDEVRDRRASQLLEALCQALDQAERLTSDIRARDEEIELLHEEIEALLVLANSLKRKLNRRRLGVFARCILDLGLGVGGNRVDSLIFEPVRPAIVTIEQECTTIVQTFDIDLVMPDDEVNGTDDAMHTHP